MRGIFRLYTRTEILRGMILYGLGDAAAALLLDRFSLPRCLGMAAVGGLLYALEIPLVFAWIERHIPSAGGVRGGFLRSALATLYFNPLWIARHLLFIALFEGALTVRAPDIAGIALRSFVMNIPVALAANYVIQNFIPLRRRFLASGIFSGLMAVYYALSEVWFR